MVLLIFLTIKRYIEQNRMFHGFEESSLHSVSGILRGEWPSGLYSLRQVTEVKLGRVWSDSGWVTTEA